MLALRSAETGRIESTTFGLFDTNSTTLVVAVAKALTLTRIVGGTDLVEIFVVFEHLDQEVNCVALMEVLLNTDSDVGISRRISTRNRNIEVLIGKESIMRIVDRVLHVLSVPDTTISHVYLVGSTISRELNNGLSSQCRIVKTLIRSSAVLDLEVESEAAVT